MRWETYSSFEITDRGLTHPFALHRLILLEARTGKREAARRHWEMLRDAVTNPDPPMVKLLEEARNVVEHGG